MSFPPAIAKALGKYVSRNDITGNTQTTTHAFRSKINRVFHKKYLSCLLGGYNTRWQRIRTCAMHYLPHCSHGLESSPNERRLSNSTAHPLRTELTNASKDKVQLFGRRHNNQIEKYLGLVHRAGHSVRKKLVSICDPECCLSNLILPFRNDKA